MNERKFVFRDLIYLGFIMLLPLSWASISIGSVYRITSIVLFGMFLLFSGGSIVIRGENIKTFAYFALYFVYCLITNLWAKNEESASANLWGTLLMLVIAFIFAGCNIKYTKSELIQICWILVGLICALLFFFGGQTVLKNSERVTLSILGSKPNANEFAALLCLTTGITVGYALKAPKVWAKIVCIILCMVEIYIILVSGSRGSLLGVVVAAAACLLTNKNISLKNFVFLIIGTGIVFLVLFVWVFPNVPGEVLERFRLETLVEDGGTGRSEIWKNAFKEIFSDATGFLFGHGADGIKVDNGWTYTDTMHNQIIQNIADYGLIGTVLYLLLIPNCYKRIRKSSPSMVGAFWGLMANSMTISMGVVVKLFWIFMMMAFVEGSSEQKTRKLTVY